MGRYKVSTEKKPSERGWNWFECGISIKDFIDFKEKDVIESYLAEEIKVLCEYFKSQKPFSQDN